MQSYLPIQAYIDQTRSSLQDLIVPYRYADTDIFDALNFVMLETSRIRPDMYLDMKYQQPLRAGDINDWTPAPYPSNVNANRIVPIPGKYFQPMVWFMSGYLQTYDVADTADQRAQAFMAKFQQHLMTVSAG
jgi:hypothetical protein